MIGPTWMQVVHSPRAGTITSKLARSAVTMAGAVEPDVHPADPRLLAGRSR